MATRRWLGTAPAIAQVTTYAFGGTWNSGDTITITIGTKSYAMTAGSSTTTVVVTNVVNALAALVSNREYPEYAEFTASGGGTTTLTLTANVPGMSFTVSFSNTGSGTIGSATNTTANSGPNDWSTAANWSGATVPVSTDDVYIDEGTSNITEGLNQSGVTLTSLTISARYRGLIGLPNRNAFGYAEYRQSELKIGATTATIGFGDGPGSGRIKLDFSSIQTTCYVYKSGTSLESGVPAVQIRGTHASNVLHVIGGDVGVAVLASHTATIATLKQSGGNVVCGTGVTLTTVTKTGGSIEINSGTTSFTSEQGANKIGAGAHTSVLIENGTLDYRSSGTIGTLETRNDSISDFRSVNVARTITTTKLKDRSTIIDPNGTITFTNPISGWKAIRAVPL